MSTTLLDRLLTPDTNEARRLRSIESYYQIRSISSNLNSLVNYERHQYQLQAKRVVNNYHYETFGGPSLVSGQSDEIVDSIYELEATLSAGFEMLDETISAGFEMVDETISAGFDMVASVLDEGFRHVAAELTLQNQTLDAISITLHEPIETRCNEMIKHAYRRLQSAMETDSSQQDFRTKDYQDAYELLLQVVQDPIGKLLPDPWFNLGWLEWRFRSKPQHARDYFLEAVRLERSRPTASYQNYLNHLAYVQYLTGQWRQAIGTATLAIENSEKARYHADYTIALAAVRLWERKATEENLYLALVSLQYLLESWPHLIAAILQEEGFAPIKDEVKRLVARLTRESRNRVQDVCREWQGLCSQFVDGYQELGTNSPDLNFGDKPQAICQNYPKMGLARLASSQRILTKAKDKLVSHLVVMRERIRKLHLEKELALIDQKILEHLATAGKWERYKWWSLPGEIRAGMDPEPKHPNSLRDPRDDAGWNLGFVGIIWLIALAVAWFGYKEGFVTLLVLISGGLVFGIMVAYLVRGIPAYEREKHTLASRYNPWQEQYRAREHEAELHAEKQVQLYDQLIYELKQRREQLQSALMKPSKS